MYAAYGSIRMDVCDLLLRSEGTFALISRDLKRFSKPNSFFHVL
jgi:hypothetical protein